MGLKSRVAAHWRAIGTALLGNTTVDHLRQYAVGKKSWLDVLNAQRESTQAKNTLVDYEVLYLTSLYRLRVLLNEINPKLLGV